MKTKIHMISALLAMLLPITQALGSATFWAKVTLDKTTSSPTGSGLVYAYGQTNNNDFKDPPHTFPVSQEFSGGWSAPSSGDVVMNLSAKANYGYKFDGWYTDAAGTTKYDKTSVSKNSSEENEGSAADGGTYYAKFVVNPDSYTLTLNKPEGLSNYTVTGPSGFNAGSSLSNGEAVTVYKGDSYTITATKADGYNFVRWDVVSGSTTTSSGSLSETSVPPLTVSITDNTMIKLVLEKQVRHYATCLGSEGGSYKVKQGNGTATTVSTENHEESGYPAVGKLTLSDAVANSGYTFVGWYKLYSNGTKSFLSYFTSTTISEAGDYTIGAEFQKTVDYTVNFIAPADGKIIYSISGSGVENVEVDGENKTETVAAGHSINLTAQSNFDSRVPKWYTADENGVKSYFSMDENLTKTFASSAVVGVDFIPVNEKIVNAIEEAQNSAAKTAMLSADAEIILGSSVKIPSGITIDLNGHTLYVDGSLKVDGVLTGGTLSRCTKLIKQEGDGLSPINPYGNVKYWITSVVNSPAASVSGTGSYPSTESHMTIRNGYGEIAYRGEVVTSGVLVCEVERSIAHNHFKENSMVSTYNSIMDAYNNDRKTQGESYSKIMILLSTGSITASSKIANSTFAVDCVGQDCENGVEIAGGTNPWLFNGGTVTIGQTGKLLNNAHPRFVCCNKVCVKALNTNQRYYTPEALIYDCRNLDLVSTWTTTGGVYAYSGKFDVQPNNYWHIFGGRYKYQPSNDYIGGPGDDDFRNNHIFCQDVDGYWVLTPKTNPNVAKIGNTEFMTFKEAFTDAVKMGGATILMLRNGTVDERLTIPPGMSIKIELSGCNISSSSPNGLFLNNGTLVVGERRGRQSCGLSCAEGFLIENNGIVEITYGMYKGDIRLNSGSKFTTHHGSFTGTMSTDGTDIHELAFLKGGVFSCDVSGALNDEYVQTGGYVGFYPWAQVSDGGMSGYDVSYTLTALSSSNTALYKNEASSHDEYSDTAWNDRAEVLSAVTPYLGYTMDVVLFFDRVVTNGSVSAYGKAQYGQAFDIDQTVEAYVPYRALSPKVAAYKQYQITYSRFIAEDAVNSIVCAVKNKKEVNKGTLCVIRLDFCSGANKYDVSKLKSEYTICEKHLVFGAGSYKAMIRPATGAADFYSTLQGGIDAVKNNGGGTVMLANNCNETPSFDTVGTYIVDSMGFEHSFSGAEGGYTVAEGLSVTAEPVTSSAAALIPSAVAIKYVVSDPVTKVVIDGEPATTEEQADLRQGDTNGNAHWQNYVMGQDGATAAAIVTSTNGTETVAEVVVSFEVPSKNTGYTVKYAFDEVDAEDKVIEAGTVQDKPQLDLTKVTKNSEPHYFKMRTVLESTDQTVTSEVPVEHTVGVMKVASDATFTILAVPWKSFDGGNVKVSELVHAASLSTDDMLYAYDGNGNLESWRVKDGVWVSMKETAGGEQGTVESDPPAEFGLARGKGVWLKRKDRTKPIYLMGMPTTDNATTALLAANEKVPSWNLVASPKLEAVDIESKFKDNTADEIIVPTAGTPKHYTYKDGKWGYPGATVTSTKKLPNGQTIQVISVEHKTDDTTITPGTGFWYLNKGGEKTIGW